MSYKSLFSRFLASDPERLHFAAHSHHLWPDVTRDAQVKAWDDAARDIDDKWGVIFGELLPQVFGHIARVLGLSDPSSLCVAPNTHEFVVRILSCLAADRPLRVLTTDAEYHSLRRQLTRLVEAGRAEVEWVAAAPFETFPERFRARAATGGHDLVFFSHVFFSSGYVVPDLASIVRAVPDDRTFVVIDGYHGFGAIPTDLRSVEGRAFYVAGGYKYAMSGEGACFLHSPPGFGERPVNTGWMASMGTIAARQSRDLVPYASDGMRFFGATFDPVGLYRFRAVMELWAEHGLDVDAIHAWVRSRQARFLERIDDLAHPDIHTSRLVPTAAISARGHFLTFATERAGALHRRLSQRKVMTDFRDDRLRFGFAIYHDDADVDELLRRLREVG